MLLFRCLFNLSLYSSNWSDHFFVKECIQMFIHILLKYNYMVFKFTEEWGKRKSGPTLSYRNTLKYLCLDFFIMPWHYLCVQVFSSISTTSVNNESFTWEMSSWLSRIQICQHKYQRFLNHSVGWKKTLLAMEIFKFLQTAACSSLLSIIYPVLKVLLCKFPIYNSYWWR